jgi:uncharacterized protein
MPSARFEFDWDPGKAVANLIKHEVAFEEAMTVFLDPLALSRPDDDDAEIEERWITIGLSRDAKSLLVVHTYVELDEERAYIRIISARKPSKRERRQYEQSRPEG